MHRHSAQKQTHTLLNTRSIAPNTRFTLLRKPSPMTTSGILFVGLAATAGISSIAFALQHDAPTFSGTPLTSSSHGSTEGSAQSSNETSLDATITSSTNSSADTTDLNAVSEVSVSGEATINNEVIPLTEGTTERSYTSADGSQNTVTITVDGSTTVVNDSDSRTRIQVSSSSSSTTSENTTRGSPRR
jgi:hypothetical protein